MLAARVGTSIVTGPLLVFLVWLGGPLLWFVAAAAAYQAAREATSLFGLPPRSVPATVARFGAPFLVLTATTGSAGLVASLAVVLVAFLLSTLLPESDSNSTFSWESALSASLYTGFPLALLILLRQTVGPDITLTVPPGTDIRVGRGAGWTLAALTLTWATDVGAYVVGRLVGRHLFIPHLSPRKTFEGTIGGVCAGTATFVAWAPPFGWSFTLAGLVGFVAAVAAVAGDLFESGMKRRAGVKDAGVLLPGHGGLLDRIDSLAFSTVVVFLWKIAVELAPGLRLGS